MKKLFTLLSAAAVTLTVSACASKVNVNEGAEQEYYQNTHSGSSLKIRRSHAENETSNKKQMKVAMLLPLSGKNANIGKQLLDASQLAAYDLQADNVNIIPINTETTTDAISKKLDAEQPDIVVGPLYAADTQKLYPLAEQRGICMISFSNDDKLTNNNCLFLLGVMPDESVKRAAQYSFNNGVEDIYAVLPDSKYGSVVETRLAEFNTEEQSKTKVLGKYSTQNFAKDSSQASVNILSFVKGNSALMIPESGKIINTIENHLKSKNTTLANYRLIGTGLWDNETIAQNKALEGAIFASPPKAMRESYEKRFFTQYGYNPSKLTTLSYDSLALVKALSGNGKSTITREKLLNPYGFKGVTGLFRFTNNGLNERALSIFSIKGGKVVEVEPAQNSFQ